MMKKITYLLLCVILCSCASKKKYNDLQLQYDQLNTDYLNAQASHDQKQKECDDTVDLQKTDIIRLESMLREAESSREVSTMEINKLKEEIEYFKNTNTNLLTRLEDLSVLSQTGAESIKKSLEAINSQNAYIKDLNTSIQQKDSVNLALVTNLKKSLEDVNDDDINIEVKKGVVYITLSDKLLYRSGSANVTREAKVVLEKIAAVVNDHNGLEILVEGHTDTDPISTTCVADNWELSAKRAISIVRILQEDYGVDPSRMTAGGRSEYNPKSANDSRAGKAENRRTEIIILPKLDEFFKLMVPEGE